MKGDKRVQSLLVCFLFAALVSFSPVASRNLEDPSLKPDCDCGPGHGGGHHHSPDPSHGSSGSHGTPSTPSYTTPTAPSHGSGGYYGTPPVVVPPPVVEPPAVPISTPDVPVIEPPVISTPTIPTPSSPLVDPNVPFSKPGTCKYWSTHPEAIYAIFGYWGSVGQYFGAACATAFGKNPSLQDALKNNRSDGIGALYREGIAAFLNSMVCKKYPMTTEQVTHAFSTAISSDKAATVQAELFKQANEGQVVKV